MDREEATQALELLRRVVTQARDDATLQNWGLVWIFHGVTNAAGFAATDWLLHSGRVTPLPYVLLWSGTLAVNMLAILALKTGGGGVRSFVENQIWLIWTTFILSAALTCILNYVIGLEVIFAGPMLAILAAVAFTSMGGVMGRRWYAYAVLFAGAAIAMAFAPQWQFTLFGGTWGLAQTGAGIHLIVDKRRRMAAGTAAPRLV